MAVLRELVETKTGEWPDRKRGARDARGQLVGESPAMTDLKAEIARVARSDAKVLVTGESGSGKELVAQAIHTESVRCERPFVAVNCAGLPETLLESELFGHVRGSFTGAYRDRLGKLEMADSGTMFLDEIGEMTLRMQGLLLRFLETGELQKVGADHVVKRVNVRVVAATNRNLRHMIGEGLFREDLFYRLNVIHLAVPALRERKQDIPALATHFLRKFADMNRDISPDAMSLLVSYSWPGNIRQLANVLRTAAVMACGEAQITEAHLSDDFLEDARRAAKPSIPAHSTLQEPLAPFVPEPFVGSASIGASSGAAQSDAATRSSRPAAPAESVPQHTLEQAEIAMIRSVLEASGGNISAASKQLGISRNTIYRKLRWNVADRER